MWDVVDQGHSFLCRGSTLFVVIYLRFFSSYRACNVVARDLAKYAMCGDPDEFLVWANPLPKFVKTVVARNLVEPVLPIVRP